MADRQATIRRAYLEQSQLLRASPDPTDRALGAKVVAFVQAMPKPDSQRLALARELRASRQEKDPRRGDTGRQRER